MIDYELTDLLIELEEIQQDRFLNKARGQQVVDSFPNLCMCYGRNPKTGVNRISAVEK